MPQMAPMLWLFLFFYFIVIFLMFISNFYFMYCPMNSNTINNTEVNTSSMSWQW